MATYSRTKSGFTLLELMVVVVIILLLVGLTTPILRKSVEDGRRSACRGNLRQMGAAFFLFATENNGWLPIINVDMSRTVIGAESLGDQWPFTQHVQMLATNQYIRDPRKFWCPSDKVSGRFGNVAMSPASNFDEFVSAQNSSYMYVAGYNLRSSQEDFSRAPVLADESNERERGDLTPGAMPNFTQDDNHGADFRNVLYLDGHVVGLEHPDVGNIIFADLNNTDILNSID